MNTLAGSIVDGVFRAALLTCVGSDQTRRAVDHPFVSDLVAATVVVFADILYKIGSSQGIVVALLPVIIPAALKALIRDGSNKMNWVSFRFQAQDNFGSPDAYGGGQRPLVRSRTAAVRSE